jgi:hypothetical protein
MGSDYIQSDVLSLNEILTWVPSWTILIELQLARKNDTEILKGSEPFNSPQKAQNENQLLPIDKRNLEYNDKVYKFFKI